MQIYTNKSILKLNYLNATSDLSFRMKTAFETQECLVAELPFILFQYMLGFYIILTGSNRNLAELRPTKRLLKKKSL